MLNKVKLANKKTETTDIANFFKALSDKNRLQIVTCLSGGTKCVCELTEAINIPQNLMSHHLGILKKSGLVHDERRGRWIYYTLDYQLIEFTLQCLNFGKQAIAKLQASKNNKTKC